MSEVGLKELIEKVKHELLASNNNQNQLLFIDKIELEIAVKVTKEGDGNVKVAVLNFFEVGAGGALTGERGNVVRVSLSPLLEREKILKTLADNEQKYKAILQDSVKALVKEDGMVGEE